MEEIKHPQLYIDIDSVFYKTIEVDHLLYKEFSNFILKNPEKTSDEIIFINEKCFVIDLFEKNYYHFIESISHFFLLKKHIKDIKLVIIEKKSSYTNDDPLLFCTSFIDLIPEEDILFINNTGYSQICIKNLFLIDGSLTNFMVEIQKHDIYTAEERATIKKAIETKFDLTQESHRQPHEVSSYCFQNLRDYFKPSKTINNKNKKIFISTKFISDKARENKYMLDIIDGINTDISEKEKKKFFDIVSNVFYNDTSNIRATVKERFIPEEEEDKIHQYFIDNGYVFIDPTKMTMKEQIDLYRECSHIATLSGSSCLSSIFCDMNTNFFIIGLNLNYRFQHAPYVKKLLHNVVCVFDGAEKDLIYTAEEVIKELEEKYRHMI